MTTTPVKPEGVDEWEPFDNWAPSSFGIYAPQQRGFPVVIFSDAVSRDYCLHAARQHEALVAENRTLRNAGVALDETCDRLRERVKELKTTLVWIASIADRNYEQDTSLRSRGARTLARISKKVNSALLKDKP